MSAWIICGLVVYGTVALGLLLGGAANYGILTVPELRRKAARLVFLAPLWPVMMVVVAVRGFGPMWRAADWKGTKR